ncbi:MAG: hydroxyacylglutathione hydrolase [Legionellales bacterium]|nr:hydroxyacylglutathione hydrolase [Legionellales bacterium]
MLTYEMVAIPALQDNYIWMMIDHPTHSAWIVDPGDAKPVFKYLQHYRVTLSGILLTHHHGDHTYGVADLIQQFPVPVLASAHSRYPHVTRSLTDNEQFSIDDAFPKIRALAIPGHTLDHMAYYVNNAVFCGDTLFGAGCGRLFEGTPAQMYLSLQKLAALPDQTQVYCGHEYTLANLRFAAIVEPNNPMIAQRIEKTMALRDQNKPTLPSLLSEEKRSNPFLRCHLSEVKHQVSAHVNCDLQDPIEVFAALRQWKDAF